MSEGEPRTPDDVPSRFQVDFTGRALLGNYRVDRRIAEGGMGAVYLAEDQSLSMRVVVKVPHARFLAEPGFRARFRREITELVRLEHPHVVRILARGEEEEVPYFVLQYLGGGSLEDRLKAGPQAGEAALSWLRTIAETLDYIHARGVVHRDVKPANILFDEEGHVFLSDFGVVKALGRDDGGEKTEAGTGVGSPLYMAPEQALGREVTGAADQYALASTLFEALAGVPPFGRGQVIELLMRKQKGVPDSLRERAPAVPEACEAAVGRALSNDPADRFPSCAAFAGAVAAALAPPAAATPARSPSRAWAGFAATVALVAFAVVAFAAGWFRRGEPPAVPATSRPAEAVSEGPPRGHDILLVTARGSAPRAVLRRRLSAGVEDHFEISTTHRTISAPDSPLKVDQSYLVVQTYRAKVAALDADGTARTEWELSAPMMTVDAGTKAAANEAPVVFDVAGAVRGTLGIRPSGALVDVALTSEHGGEKGVAEVVEGRVEELRTLEVVFPEEALGVGAEWNVTQQARSMGVQFQETVTFTLVSRDGDRIRLGFRSVANVPPQTVDAPGTKARLDMRSFAGSSEGTALVDLTRPAPTEFEMRSKTKMEAVYHGADPAKATLKGDVVQELRLRRE